VFLFVVSCKFLEPSRHFSLQVDSIVHIADVCVASVGHI